MWLTGPEPLPMSKPAARAPVMPSAVMPIIYNTVSSMKGRPNRAECRCKSVAYFKRERRKMHGTLSKKTFFLHNGRSFLSGKFYV